MEPHAPPAWASGRPDLGSAWFAGVTCHAAGNRPGKAIKHPMAHGALNSYDNIRQAHRQPMVVRAAVQSARVAFEGSCIGTALAITAHDTLSDVSQSDAGIWAPTVSSYSGLIPTSPDVEKTLTARLG